MRSLGIIIGVAVVLAGCQEVLDALGDTVDIPADSYSVAEGRTRQIPVNVRPCDGPSETCVTWSSDDGCVARFDVSTVTGVHFGTTVVHAQGTDVALSDHAQLTVTPQTPVRIQLAPRLIPVPIGGIGVLAVKLFDASDYQLRRPATFSTGDTTVLVADGVDPGCDNLWPDGVQIRGVRPGTTFVFARFETLVDSVSVTVQ